MDWWFKIFYIPLCYWLLDWEVAQSHRKVTTCDIGHFQVRSILFGLSVQKIRDSCYNLKLQTSAIPRTCASLYEWFQNSVTNHSWSNISTTNNQLFLDQNVTPQFWGCSSFSNIFIISPVFLLMQYLFYWKTLVIPVHDLPQHGVSKHGMCTWTEANTWSEQHQGQVSCLWIGHHY